MSEPLEKFIKESLEKETPPKLSPFFAARITNRVKSEQKSNPLWQIPLLFYWCFFSFFTFFMLTNINWLGWGTILIIIILIPLSFLLPSVLQEKN